MLAAFGLSGTARPLAGGTGQSARSGDVVLKPAGDAAEACWLADLADRLRPANTRLPRPLRAVDGRWVVEGWTASAYLPGRERSGRWAETIGAGRALHATLEAEPRPSLLAARTHRWAHADRVAWEEVDDDMGPLGRELTSRYDVVELRRQLVHCDLSGNVLFHENEPPAVIDLSLYWRPPAYAEAIIAVDALLWCDAPATLLDLLQHPDATQLLLRATVFRLSTDLSPDHLGDHTPIASFERLAALLAAR